MAQWKPKFRGVKARAPSALVARQRAEERVLIAAAQSTDAVVAAAAQRALLAKWERGLVSLTRVYIKRDATNYEDVLQEARMGFIKGVLRFKLDKYSHWLWTYASQWAHAAITRAMLWDRTFRFGTTEAERSLFTRASSEEAKHYMRTGRAMTDLEMVEIIHPGARKRLKTEKRALKAVRAFRAKRTNTLIPVSLDQHVLMFADGEESDIRLVDRVRAANTNVEAALTYQERFEVLRRAIAKVEASLNVRERALLYERLLKERPLPLVVLGDRFHLSKERMRQLEVKVIQMLREAYKECEK